MRITIQAMGALEDTPSKPIHYQYFHDFVKDIGNWLGNNGFNWFIVKNETSFEVTISKEKLIQWCDNPTSINLINLAYAAKKLNEPKPKKSALAEQVGGQHYKLSIQPVEYIHANGLGYFEGCVIKYVTRWKNKGGVQDLDKAIHYLELLKELEQKNASNS